MIDRKEEILKIGKDLLKQRFLDNKEIILQKYKNRKDIILKEVLKKLRSYINEILVLQSDEEKSEKIKYISISFLRSSLITKTYDFVFSLHNKLFYADESYKYLYLNINFIFEYFEKDIKFFIDNNNNLHLQSYEIYYFQEEYIKGYYKIAFIIFKDVLKIILNEEIFKNLNKEDDYKVVFGEYMGEFSEIQMEDKDEIFSDKLWQRK